MISIMECSICTKVKKVNLLLLGKNICTECERSLIKAEVEDMSYNLYMDGIKNILVAPSKK